MFRKQAKRLLARLSANDYQTLNRVELRRANVLANIKLIQDQHPGIGIIPVLKANAYGHGLEEVATILNDADCGFLAVDGYFEAAAIRHVTRHPILVLGYIKPENAKLLDIRKCSFVVQDVQGLQAFGQLNRRVRIHLELNTGMNRLGLSEGELPEYLQTLASLPNLELEGVMTHLADADNGLDDSFTARQAEQFDRIFEVIKHAGFNPKYVHLAQTAGSAKAKSKYANSIRLGIGLYGLNPLKASDKHFKDLRALQPVMELKSTIIKIIDLKKGGKVGYNGIFTAPKAMKIGVLPLGYYEGVPRELSNKGTFTYKGSELPIVGRVCMNHTMVNLRDLPVTVGDEVTVISSDPSQPNSVERICQNYKLFNYLLVTKLSSSIRRTIT
jgi:alanine racemase